MNHLIYVAMYIQTLSTGSDFTTASFRITIPPNEDNCGEFVIPQLFTVIDDEINEVVQSFVLVAEIGADVPESFTCFQREEGETGCNANMEPTARFGATKIQINDNDGRLDLHSLVHVIVRTYMSGPLLH